MATDILGAVYDFILAHVHNEDVPPLSQDSIVRGWQNIVSALPENSQEYVVLTLLQTIRHGTNIRIKSYNQSSGIAETVSRIAEHIVQIDFCSSYPSETEERARIRAEIAEMLHRDRIAIDFYRKYGISSCYADDILPVPFLNEAEQWIARYCLTIHLSTWTAKNTGYGENEYFENVNIKVRPSSQNEEGNNKSIRINIENVDIHHI